MHDGMLRCTQGCDDYASQICTVLVPLLMQCRAQPKKTRFPNLSVRIAGLLPGFLLYPKNLSRLFLSTQSYFIFSGYFK